MSPLPTLDPSAYEYRADIEESLFGTVSKPMGLSTQVDVDIEKLRLNGKTMSVQLQNSIIDADIERTIEAASTITITLQDSDRALLKTGIFNEAATINFDEFYYDLVKVGKVGDTVKLTFEDQEVTRLRSYNEPRKVKRGATTRAEFALTLVREAKPPIRFYSPEIHKRQPVRSPARESSKSSESSIPQKRSKRSSDERRSPGLSSGRLTIKGATANGSQRDLMELAMKVADRLNASKKATFALLEACIVESGFKNVNMADSDRDSQGVLQVRRSTDPRGKDSEYVMTKFLRKGYWGKGGAMALARKNPGKGSGWVAQQTQGSAFPGRYQEVQGDAEKIYDAYKGGSGGGGDEDDGGSGSRTVTVVKPYEFKRGEGGKPEDTWTALGRLADEVGWRRYIVAGTVYFISEEDLFKSRTRLRISEDSPGIDWIDFDFDSGKITSEATVLCRADRWVVPPGVIVEVVDSGPADGRWLVSSISRSFYDPNATINLKKPRKELPEPAPETSTKTISERSGGGRSKGGGSNNLRERIIEVARSSMTSKTGFSRYSQAGALTTDLTPNRARTDCSQWTRAVYLKAGARDPGVNTWAQVAKGRRTNNPKPGDLFFPNDKGHVEIFVGKSAPRDRNMIGHGSAPIDYGSTNTWPGHFFVTFPWLD